MNKKGKSTLIGALVGFFGPYLIACITTGSIEMDWGGFLFFLLPAILGAIIGFAFGGKDKSSDNGENAIGKDEQSQNKTAVSELLDYKKLLDAGIITQEEFDKKKEELLNNL